MIPKSTTTSTSRRGFETSARQSAGGGPSSCATRALLQVGEEAGELDEHDERDEDADGRHARVAERRVREACRAEERGEQRQPEHGLLLGEAVVDEAVRRVVGSALRHRPPLERAPHRDEGGVEDRDREHEQRQQERRQRGAGRRPARRERERGEAEAEHLAARVAHEHRGPLARPQVEGEEAEARAAERERDDHSQVSSVPRDRVDGEDRAGDRREGRREAVHVVEQVERVRDPDEPDEPERRRDQVVADHLDGEPGDEHDAGRRELRCRASRPGSACAGRRRALRGRGSCSRRGCRRARCSRRRLRRQPRRRLPRRARRRCRLRRTPASAARASARRRARPRAGRRTVPAAGRRG